MAKNDSTWTNAVRHFFRTTTLHGFKYLFSEFYMDRIGWLICCCTSTCCAALLSTVLWERFLEVPAVLELRDLQSDDAAYQHMPLMAVCPPVDASAAMLVDILTTNATVAEQARKSLAQILSGNPTSVPRLQLLETMERTNKFKYYVIQFLELPYPDIDKYVCVPWTWIVMRRKMDQKVIVSYPVENPSETAKRVKRRQKCSDDWNLFKSDVKYGTDLYEDAKIFIKEKLNDVNYEYKCSNLKNGDKKLSVPVEKKLCRSKRNSKSNHEIDKPLDLVETSMNDDKSATKRLKRTTLPRPDTEAALKLSKVVEPTESVSDATEQPSQAPDCLSEQERQSVIQKSSNLTNSLNHEIDKPLDSVVTSMNDDKSATKQLKRTTLPRPETEAALKLSKVVELTESVSDVTEQPSQAPDCLSEQARQSNLTNSLSNPKPMLDPTFLKGLFTVLKNLHTVSANSYTLVDNLRKVIMDNTEAMKDVKQLIVDSRSVNSDIPNTSPLTNTTAEVEEISEKNKRKQKQRDEENDDHGEDDTDEVPKKRYCKKRRFVLPPEYDENDSRWTLKYRESAPGLVELMPHTDVYINAVKLSNCKRLSKDCNSLARLLLVEMFTKSALTICSLTGSRARAYVVEGDTVRPGLDENARTVLLAYVEEYGREKGWITLDTASIQNSIRNKIQEFRFKYG